MEYKKKYTDLETGEVVTISIGDHLPFSEVASKLQISRSTLIKVMSELGLCHKEYDPVALAYRNRLVPEAAEKGLGFRILGQHGPFDVLSPIGIEYVQENLPEMLEKTSLDKATRDALAAVRDYEQKRRTSLNTEGKVTWLLDYFPDLELTQLAAGLGISRQVVHRYKKKKEDQLKRALRRRTAPLNEFLDWPCDHAQDWAERDFA